MAPLRGTSIQSPARKRAQKCTQGSIEDFDAALAADPSLLPYLWQRGLSLYYVQRFEEGAKQVCATQRVIRQLMFLSSQGQEVLEMVCSSALELAAGAQLQCSGCIRYAGQGSRPPPLSQPTPTPLHSTTTATTATKQQHQFRDDVAVNPNDTEESIWSFLCEAQTEGPEAARAKFLEVRLLEECGASVALVEGGHLCLFIQFIQ